MGYICEMVGEYVFYIIRWYIKEGKKSIRVFYLGILYMFIVVIVRRIKIKSSRKILN